MDYESYYAFSGRLVRDPEQRRTESGKLCVTCTIAHEHKNKKSDFYKCIAWEKVGELIMQLHKGSNILVSTTPTINSWTDKDGNKRYTPEFTINSLFFLDKKKDDFEDLEEDTGELPF